jgi:hypothetical protein
MMVDQATEKKKLVGVELTQTHQYALKFEEINSKLVQKNVTTTIKMIMMDDRVNAK